MGNTYSVLCPGMLPSYLIPGFVKNPASSPFPEKAERPASRAGPADVRQWQDWDSSDEDGPHTGAETSVPVTAGPSASASELTGRMSSSGLPTDRETTDSSLNYTKYDDEGWGSDDSDVSCMELPPRMTVEADISSEMQQRHEQSPTSLPESESVTDGGSIEAYVKEQSEPQLKAVRHTYSRSNSNKGASYSRSNSNKGASSSSSRRSPKTYYSQQSDESFDFEDESDRSLMFNPSYLDSDDIRETAILDDEYEDDYDLMDKAHKRSRSNRGGDRSFYGTRYRKLEEQEDDHHSTRTSSDVDDRRSMRTISDQEIAPSLRTITSDEDLPSMRTITSEEDLPSGLVTTSDTDDLPSVRSASDDQRSVRTSPSDRSSSQRSYRSLSDSRSSCSRSPSYSDEDERSIQTVRDMDDQHSFLSLSDRDDQRSVLTLSDRDEDDDQRSVITLSDDQRSVRTASRTASFQDDRSYNSESEEEDDMHSVITQSDIDDEEDDRSVKSEDQWTIKRRPRPPRSPLRSPPQGELDEDDRSVKSEDQFTIKRRPRPSSQQDTERVDRSDTSEDLVPFVRMQHSSRRKDQTDRSVVMSEDQLAFPKMSHSVQQSDGTDRSGKRHEDQLGFPKMPQAVQHSDETDRSGNRHEDQLGFPKTPQAVQHSDETDRSGNRHEDQLAFPKMPHSVQHSDETDRSVNRHEDQLTFQRMPSSLKHDDERDRFVRNEEQLTFTMKLPHSKPELTEESMSEQTEDQRTTVQRNPLSEDMTAVTSKPLKPANEPATESDSASEVDSTVLVHGSSADDDSSDSEWECRGLNLQEDSHTDTDRQNVTLEPLTDTKLESEPHVQAHPELIHLPQHAESQHEHSPPHQDRPLLPHPQQQLHTELHERRASSEGQQSHHQDAADPYAGGREEVVRRPHPSTGSADIRRQSQPIPEAPRTRPEPVQRRQSEPPPQQPQPQARRAPEPEPEPEPQTWGAFFKQTLRKGSDPIVEATTSWTYMFMGRKPEPPPQNTQESTAGRRDSEANASLASRHESSSSSRRESEASLQSRHGTPARKAHAQDSQQGQPRRPSAESTTGQPAESKGWGSMFKEKMSFVAAPLGVLVGFQDPEPETQAPYPQEEEGADHHTGPPGEHQQQELLAEAQGDEDTGTQPPGAPGSESQGASSAEPSPEKTAKRRVRIQDSSDAESFEADSDSTEPAAAAGGPATSDEAVPPGFRKGKSLWSTIVAKGIKEKNDTEKVGAWLLLLLLVKEITRPSGHFVYDQWAPRGPGVQQV